jgi:hypothetical protein
MHNSPLPPDHTPVHFSVGDQPPRRARRRASQVITLAFYFIGGALWATCGRRSVPLLLLPCGAPLPRAPTCYFSLFPSRCVRGARGARLMFVAVWRTFNVALQCQNMAAAGDGDAAMAGGDEADFTARLKHAVDSFPIPEAIRTRNPEVQKKFAFVKLCENPVYCPG